MSAPGAVGKSTFAKAIALQKGALLFDLATAKEVAAGSLNGMLLDTLGPDYIGEYNHWLSEGLQFLIIDALDEGRNKVGENSFRRFLEDVGKLANGANGVCFILLGRTRIAEEAWLVLDELNVRASILAIEPFEREQANEYIERRMEGKPLTQLFLECRDLIFDQLAFSVSGNLVADTTREFLHYPPVLDVIATLLDPLGNPVNLKNELENAATGSNDTARSLLMDVIEHILLRERDKILPALEATLLTGSTHSELPTGDVLCGTDIQCERLLAKVLGASVVPPPGLPAELQYDYESVMSLALEEHPFLQGMDRFANSVFQSYLFALALRNKFGAPLKDRVTQELLRVKYKPTRLLAEFYLNAYQDSADPGLTIEPEHLGILYDSLASSESFRNHIRLNLDGSNPIGIEGVEDIDTVDGDFEFWSLSGLESGLLYWHQFSMQIRQDSQISFTRHLRDAFVTAACTVALGGGKGEFQIGPSVHIVADSIRFASELLIVGGNSILKPDEEDADSVVLETLMIDAGSFRNLIVYDDDKFSVSWPGSLVYPWTRYSRSISPEDLGDDEPLHRAYMGFKRIANAFRSHGRGQLARTVQKIDSPRVLKGPLGQSLLEQLKADGILDLRENGRRYYWISGRADELLGVSWQDLRRGECPTMLRDYLSKFVGQHSHLF